MITLSFEKNHVIFAMHIRFGSGIHFEVFLFTKVKFQTRSDSLSWHFSIWRTFTPRLTFRKCTRTPNILSWLWKTKGATFWICFPFSVGGSDTVGVAEALNAEKWFPCMICVSNIPPAFLAHFPSDILLLTIFVTGRLRLCLMWTSVRKSWVIKTKLLLTRKNWALCQLLSAP